MFVFVDSRLSIICYMNNLLSTPQSPVGASEFVMDFICSCASYFTTAKISFNSILYLQVTHMIFIIYTSQQSPTTCVLQYIPLHDWIESWEKVCINFTTEFLTTSHFYNSFLKLLSLVCWPSHLLSRQSLHNVCVEVTFLGTEFTKTAFVIKKSLIPSKTQYRVACIVSESTWQGLHTKDSSFRSSMEKRGF